MLPPSHKLSDIHRTMAVVCSVTNKLENFSSNLTGWDILHQIIPSNVENDGRIMASTQYWQMVADTLPWFIGPQRHASSADKLDLNVRHSQMCSGQWLTSILTEMLDIRVTKQNHLDWTTCNLRVTTVCHHLKHNQQNTPWYKDRRELPSA